MISEKECERYMDDEYRSRSEDQGIRRQYISELVDQEKKDI